ncbi:FGGY-family carbohydrate kinase [Cysteiniphilum halobium]|uniref:FGGY-family carbohydrate kinase n=1 Tax=Cysteiniphilum halobium TaxID=2219059 RepID=UPI000E65CE0F|nr:FGGY family carbohydrate kinase [Cysteiniphilum halobium]
MQNCAILDIGKTHIKLAVLNERYETLVSAQCNNITVMSAPYPHVDIDGIWNWFIAQLTEISDQYAISAINIATHGATAALVKASSNNDSGLLLPVIDYEWNGVEKTTDYLKLRPKFEETFSPLLPAGLNLGRQIYWLSKCYPNEFLKADAILLYPQYWAWRMSGKMVTEITSLGCHSDLWNVKESSFSSLVLNQKWQNKFPALCSADKPIGVVSNKFANQTGVQKDCLIYSGLHDSNASYLRYLDGSSQAYKTIISTGTWTISFSPSTPLNRLLQSQDMDMLLNINIYGQPIACARFMGGREYASICQQFKLDVDTNVSESDLQQVINDEVFATPSFSNSGPFAQIKGKIIGNPKNGAALAVLYVALLMSYELDLLDNKSEEVVISGAFVNNILLCRVFAQLRSHQKVKICNGITGAIIGAASLCLSKKYTEVYSRDEIDCHPTQLNHLVDYAKKWEQKTHEESHRISNRRVI